MSGHTRRRFVAAVGLGALAGCTETPQGDGGDGPSGGGGEVDGGSGGGDQGAPRTPAGNGTEGGAAGTGSIVEDLPTADERLPLPTSPTDLQNSALSGGPAKDGIPSIDDPSFIAPAEVDFLDPGDPVFGVTRGDAVKAYPRKILAHHEIVNDTLDGDPVAVTYCPLTGTAQGFERGATTFGVSGRLINNNLVMYDRATDAWWPQILATSIPGPWHESPPIVSLREFQVVWTTWEQWRALHPETDVLSTATGHARNYRADPYGSYNPKGGYYTSDSTLFAPMNEDDRFHPKRGVVGARTPAGAVAFDKEAVRRAGTMTGTLGETPVLAVADPRLGSVYVYENPQERTFALDGVSVVDADGGTHPPDGLPLDRLVAFDAMWFAWSGYYPDSNVYA
jgi:hypothetical protein